MADDVVHQLEQAALIVLAPHSVSQEQRLAAENVFLQFRKTKMPYDMCRQIMERTQNAYVLFQVATTIKECVVREWTLLESSAVDSLRTFLLHYVIQNQNLQSYVREQMLQAVAVIFKRGTLDNDVTDRDSLFSDVTRLISSGDMSMQMVACSILTALLNEYSSTSRSSNVGLTWEFHSRCKIAFEQKDLKRVFVFCLQVLHELEKVPSPLERDVMTVFNRFLSITEQILSWEFLPKHLPRQYIGSFLGNSSVSFKPPASWKDLVLDKGLMEVLFRLHRKIRYNSEMAHRSLQCLAQLASMNGPVFPDHKSKTTHLSNFVQNFLGLITSTQLQDYEALGIANVINCLVIFFPINRFLSLPEDLFSAFLHNLTKLTTSFGQAAAMEEALHKDDTIYMEAYEKTLDAWMTFLKDAQDLPESALKQSAIEIFNSYLQSHLAAPDGTRTQGENDDDEEYNEIVGDDRERFKDQLTCIGTFAREIPEHVVPLMTRLLEDRVNRLHGQLQRMMQHGLDPANTSISDNGLLNAINEDLHWILLVSTFLLTDEAEGETPMIPGAIMDYSISQSQKIDLHTTLKVLASPGSQANAIPGSENATDHVVRLVSAVLRLCEVERSAIAANLAPHLSPQVGTTTMWFLKRWVHAYLFPNETYYSQISPALQSAFGTDTEGAQWVMSYILDKVIDNLHTWSSEEDLVTDTLRLLVALVEKKQRGEHALKCQSLWKLARQVADNQSPFSRLSAQAQRHLYKALVLAGSSSIQGLEQEQQITSMLSAKRHLAVAAGDASHINPNTPGMELLMLVLGSVQRRFELAVNRPDLKQVMASESVKSDILLVLESLCGVAEATRANSVTVAFEFIHILLNQCAALIDLYHNYEDVVQLVLDLLNTVANRQICYLNYSDTKKMYSCTLDVIQVYAKHNRGRVVVSLDSEEDRFADILTLMELLTNFLSKDFIDFAVKEDNGEDEGEHVSAADVVIIGLETVVPLMTLELLKFPDLCTAYYRLIAYMGEIHANKCDTLKPELFKALMESIELGISSFSPDTTKLCLEFITAMATHVHHGGDAAVGRPAHTAMAHFLTVVFKMLLVETFDMDLMETASQAFFSLICCNKDHYHKLVNELLSQQNEQQYYQRLVQAFTDLTPPTLPLIIARPNRIAFRNNFNKFIVNIRGFLVIK